MAFSDFLNTINKKPIRVLDASIENSKYIPLNLSKNNKELFNVDVSSSKRLGDYINSHISKHKGLIAFGGYKEVRSIYKRSLHFNNKILSERDIHLGVDLWSEVGTSIYSPIDGIVHSFKNNRNYGDYGPTIILKHDINNNIFYTLYGHLSIESINSIKVGQVFKKGDVLAFLGNAEVNGDYPPHLHFQIIKDIQDYVGDYPGVCSKKDLEFYVANCPDPNLLLKIEKE